MKIPGPNKRRKKPNFSHEVNAMALASGNDILPEVHLPRPYKPRPNARHKHDMREARFRTGLIKHLRKNFCRVWRIENSLPGNKGIPDLWVICLKTLWGGWVELKSEEGKLRPEQKDFLQLCKRSNINYKVVRTLEDTREILSIDKSNR